MHPILVSDKKEHDTVFLAALLFAIDWFQLHDKKWIPFECINWFDIHIQNIQILRYLLFQMPYIVYENNLFAIVIMKFSIRYCRNVILRGNNILLILPFLYPSNTS